MKSLILLESYIKDLDIFKNSIKDIHKQITYYENTLVSDIIKEVDNSFTNLAFVYHNPGHCEVPFFLEDNLKRKFKYFSDNLISLFNQIKKITGNLTIDLITCNLNREDFKTEIQMIENEFNIKFNYSVDLTGNDHGNWIMENTGLDIKDLYFNENIKDWNYTLVGGVTMATLYTNNPSLFSKVGTTYTLLNDMVLPNDGVVGLSANTDFIILGDNDVFDGNSKTITIGSPATWGINKGLFTSSVTDVTKRPSIKNLSIKSMQGIGEGGAFVKNFQQFIEIQNCQSIGNIVKNNAGGFCGRNISDTSGNSILDRCCFIGDVSGNGAGGICGANAGNSGILSLTNCDCSGSYITQAGGGILGAYAASGQGMVDLSNCYSISKIGGYIGFIYPISQPNDISYAGGICGAYAGYNGTLRLTKCYSTGNIVGSYCGGILGAYAGVYDGSSTNAIISNIYLEGCWATGNISLSLTNSFSQGYCGGIVGPYFGDCSGGQLGYGRTSCSIINCRYNGTGDNFTGYNNGSIIGPFSGNNSLNCISGLYHPCIKVSQSYANLPPLVAYGSSNYGSLDISDSYTTNIIKDDNGGIIGTYSGKGGDIKIINCYAQNYNPPEFLQIGVGSGIIGLNLDIGLVTGNILIQNSYYNVNPVDDINNFYGSGWNPSSFTIIDSSSNLDKLKYTIDPSWSSSIWISGNSNSSYDIYPRIKNFVDKTSLFRDYKYLTNRRTPDYYPNPPYDVSINTTIYDDLPIVNIIDLRDWIINYLRKIELQNYLMSGRSLAFDKMGINSDLYLSKRYLIFPPNFDTPYPVAMIDPYTIGYDGYQYYDGYYFPLEKINDKAIFDLFPPDNWTGVPPTKWTMTKLTGPKVPDAMNIYDVSNVTYELSSVDGSYSLVDFSTQILPPCNLIAGSCTIVPLLLDQVDVTSVQVNPQIPGKLTSTIINWNNNISGATGYFGTFNTYNFTFNSWEVSLELPQIFSLQEYLDVSNTIICFNHDNSQVPFDPINNPDILDPTKYKCYWDTSQNSGYDNHWSNMVLAPGTKFGYQIQARGNKITTWDSPPKLIPFEFNNPYLDISSQGFAGTNTDTNYDGLFVTPEEINTKIITGGVTLLNSALDTPILNYVTIDPSNNLNISWNIDFNAEYYKVTRYYYNMVTLKYVYDTSFDEIFSNSFVDTTWDKTKKIIGYTVIAYPEKKSFTRSQESLVSPYINSTENIIMIANIPCYYDLVSGVKVLKTSKNTLLKNYFGKYTGVDLSNKRSEAFFDYFQVSDKTANFIQVDKAILNFTGKAYSQPYYLIYNCDYVMQISHYIDVTAHDFVNNGGIYVPLKDDQSFCIFYVGIDMPISDLESPINTYYKITKEIQLDENIQYSSIDGTFDSEFNFIPITEPVFYDLDEIFYMNDYVTITGGITINNQGPIPCLTKDTVVLTTKGFINVQKLRKGDYVITDDLRKVEIKNVLITYVKGNEQNSPYIIPKNSIDENYPPSTFKISPTHLIKYKNLWIHPRESKLFEQEITDKIIKYYHIELENYKTDNLVINGGAVVESFGGYDKHAFAYKKRRSYLRKIKVKKINNIKK